MLSAAVTHAHPEGKAGAIAVAVATAVATSSAGSVFAPPIHASADVLEQALARTPSGPTRDGLARARDLGPRASVVTAAQTLGVGWQVTSADTVPFALWVASRHLDLSEAALWTAGSGFGDRDTICAIVGGVVGARVGIEGLPPVWRARREPFFLRPT